MLCFSPFSQLEALVIDVQWSATFYNEKGECVLNNMHVVSTNDAKTLVYKRDYDVIL